MSWFGNTLLPIVKEAMEGTDPECATLAEVSALCGSMDPQVGHYVANHVSIDFLPTLLWQAGVGKNKPTP